MPRPAPEILAGRQLLAAGEVGARPGEVFAFVGEDGVPVALDTKFEIDDNAMYRHADLAWALMHIMINEPLDGQEKPKGSMEIFE